MLFREAYSQVLFLAGSSTISQGVVWGFGCDLQLFKGIPGLLFISFAELDG